MGYFFLYWLIGIIILSIGWYNLEGRLTVGHLIGCIFAALFWPIVILVFAYAAYEDKVIIQKKKRRYE